MVDLNLLIRDLLDLDVPPDTVVWVKVDVEGIPHRLPLGSAMMDGDKLVLVGEPEPTPDPVISVPVENVGTGHQHVWSQDPVREMWRCVGSNDCFAEVKFEKLLRLPAAATEAEALETLNRLARESVS